jgi:hypothetical protein
MRVVGEAVCLSHLPKGGLIGDSADPLNGTSVIDDLRNVSTRWKPSAAN